MELSGLVALIYGLYVYRNGYQGVAWDSHEFKVISSVQFSSFTQSCLTICDPMNHSTPGLPVHHQLLEFPQTHVHWVGDAIQPSHPLVSSSCPQSLPASGSFPMSQLFAWGGPSIGVSASASVLPMNTQDWSSLHKQNQNSPTKIKYKRLTQWTKETKNYIYQLRIKLKAQTGKQN